MKSELFAKILSSVAEITELSEEQILSKTKTEDLVAARCLFVHFCVAKGLPSISITAFLNRNRTACIGRYLSAYQSFYKQSGYFRDMSNAVNNLLASCA